MRAALSGVAAKLDGLALDATLTFALRLAAAGAVYLGYVLLARGLEQSAFGDFVFAQSSLWLAAAVANLGINSGLLRFVPEALAVGDRSHLRGCLRWAGRTLGWSSLATTIVLAGAVWWFDPGLTSLRGQLLAVAVLCIGLANFNLGAAQVARGMDWYVFGAVTGMFARPVLFLALAASFYFANGGRLDALVLMAVQGGIIAALLAGQVVVLRPRLVEAHGGAEPRERAGQWLGVSVLLLVSGLYTAYFVDVHVFLSGLLLEPEALAVFNAVLRTLSVVSFASAAVGVALAPRAARAFAAGDTLQLAAMTRRAVHFTFWPSLAMLGALAVVGPWVLGLFGEAYAARYDVLLVSSIAQALAAISTPLASLLGMTGEERTLLRVTLLALLAAAVAHAALIPMFGLTGAAWALVVASAVWTALLYGAVVRRLGIDPVTGVAR